MRARSCGTIAPAPRLRWPTSELPIWPSGSPTASPLAVSCVCGCSSHSRRRPASRRARSRCPGRPGRAPSRRGSRARPWGTLIRVAGLHDLRERRRVEARAADQRAVDVGQRQQLGGVVGLDASRRRGSAPVRRRRRRGRRRARARTRSPPAPGRAWRPCRCRSPRSARRRCTTSASCSAATFSSPSCTWWRSLRSVSPRSRSSSVSPTQRIGVSPASSAAGTFCCERAVGLVEVLAALGVAEDRAVDVDLHEHRRRDLAGERALVGLVHVLRVDLRRCEPRAESTTPAAP